MLKNSNHAVYTVGIPCIRVNEYIGISNSRHVKYQLDKHLNYFSVSPFFVSRSAWCGFHPSLWMKMTIFFNLGYHRLCTILISTLSCRSSTASTVETPLLTCWSRMVVFWVRTHRAVWTFCSLLVSRLLLLKFIGVFLPIRAYSSS